MNTASGFASAPRTWFRNRARPTPTGTAMMTARNDVTAVPKMNGNAPKSSRPRTGFHVVPMKKWSPNCSNVRQAPAVRSISM